MKRLRLRTDVADPDDSRSRALSLRLDDLMEQDRIKVDAMSEDERAHMRHAQRASFAYGNVALSLHDPTPGQLRELRAASVAACGPCPCRPCVLARGVMIKNVP